LDDVAEQVGVGADPEVRRRLDDLPHAVDVALHEVPAEAVAEPHRSLQVDGVPGRERPEGGAGVGLLDDVGLPPALVPVPAHDGEADPVDGDRRAHRDVLEHRPGGEAQPRALAGHGGAELLDDPGEHQGASWSAVGTRSMRRSGRGWRTDTIRPRLTASIVGAPGPAKSPRASSPPKSAGARYRTYRSTRPSWWSWWATVAPPSTSTCRQPWAPRSSSRSPTGPWWLRQGWMRAPSGA